MSASAALAAALLGAASAPAGPPPVLAALRLASPLAALGLVLALLVLAVGRKAPRAAPQASATLALWRKAARSVAGESAPRRRAPPAWRALLAAAIALASLALARPEARRAAPERELLVLLDTSPSMHLPLDPAVPAGTTRLESALARTRALLDALAAAEATPLRVRWQRVPPPDASAAGAHEARGVEPPAAWLAADASGAEPAWEAWDREGVLWVADRAPQPLAAGLVASGGPAVPGPVGSADGERIAWDGRDLRADGSAAPEQVLVSGALPPALEAVLAAWCDARGLRLSRLAPEAGDAPVVLRVEGPPVDAQAQEGARAVERDGWRARARLAAAGAPGTGSAWWSSGAAPRAALVRVERGRLGHAFLALELEPAPDEAPEAFALSWAAAFDQARGAAPGVVPLAERLAAGEPRLVEPTPVRAEAATGDGTWSAASAAAAALCALGALLALRRRERRPPRALLVASP